MSPMTGPMDDELVGVVAESVEAAIRHHGTNIVFQQVRTTPERIIVHFSAFELRQQLECRWPQQFRVELEEGNRNDMLIRPTTTPPFVFEFKVPWSGDMIVRKVVKDMAKVAAEKRGYVVTVFVTLLKTPDWAAQRVARFTAAQMSEAVLDCVRQQQVDLSALVVREGAPIRIESDEAQMECTVMVWRAERRSQGGTRSEVELSLPM